MSLNCYRGGRYYRLLSNWHWFSKSEIPDRNKGDNSNDDDVRDKAETVISCTIIFCRYDHDGQNQENATRRYGTRIQEQKSQYAPAGDFLLRNEGVCRQVVLEESFR